MLCSCSCSRKRVSRCLAGLSPAGLYEATPSPLSKPSPLSLLSPLYHHIHLLRLSRLLFHQTGKLICFPVTSFHCISHEIICSSRISSDPTTIMSEPLTKVDSAVQGLSSSPPKEKGHRRTSSSAAGVMTINEISELSRSCNCC